MKKEWENGVVFTVRNDRAARALRYAFNSLGSKAGDLDWTDDTKLPLTGHVGNRSCNEDLRLLECIRLQMLKPKYSKVCRNCTVCTCCVTTVLFGWCHASQLVVEERPHAYSMTRSCTIFTSV